jgi:hypothetical protein
MSLAKRRTRETNSHKRFSYISVMRIIIVKRKTR